MNMEKTKKNKLLSTITLLLMLTMIFPLAVLSTANAHTPHGIYLLLLTLLPNQVL